MVEARQCCWNDEAKIRMDAVSVVRLVPTTVPHNFSLCRMCEYRTIVSLMLTGGSLGTL